MSIPQSFVIRALHRWLASLDIDDSSTVVRALRAAAAELDDAPNDLVRDAEALLLASSSMTLLAHAAVQEASSELGVAFSDEDVVELHESVRLASDLAEVLTELRARCAEDDLLRIVEGMDDERPRVPPLPPLPPADLTAGLEQVESDPRVARVLTAVGADPAMAKQVLDATRGDQAYLVYRSHKPITYNAFRAGMALVIAPSARQAALMRHYGEQTAPTRAWVMNADTGGASGVVWEYDLGASPDGHARRIAAQILPWRSREVDDDDARATTLGLPPPT